MKSGSNAWPNEWSMMRPQSLGGIPCQQVTDSGDRGVDDVHTVFSRSIEEQIICPLIPPIISLQRHHLPLRTSSSGRWHARRGRSTGRADLELFGCVGDVWGLRGRGIRAIEGTGCANLRLQLAKVTAR
jgi:hypothetical protein